MRSCVGTAAAKRDQTRAPNALSTGTPLRGGVCDVVCGLRFVKRRAGPGFITFLNFYPPPPKRGHPRPRPRPRRPSSPTADRRPPTAAHRPPPARRPCPWRKSSRVESSRVESRALLHTDRDSPPLATSPCVALCNLPQPRMRQTPNLLSRGKTLVRPPPPRVVCEPSGAAGAARRGVQFPRHGARVRRSHRRASVRKVFTHGTRAPGRGLHVGRGVGSRGAVDGGGWV